jgi:hypothetical protein
MRETADSNALHQNRWWKIALILALLAFEAMRELYVEQSDQINQLPNLAVGAPSSYRSQDGSFVTAEGRWERTDGGDALPRGVVTIQCERVIGSCIIAETTVQNGYVGTPAITRLPAKFTNTGAEFANEMPTCSHLFVRIDGVHDVTTGNWTPTGSADPECKDYKPVEMRLGAGFQEQEFRNSRHGHFTPIFDVVDPVIGFVLRML